MERARQEYAKIVKDEEESEEMKKMKLEHHMSKRDRRVPNKLEMAQKEKEEAEKKRMEQRKRRREEMKKKYDL